MENNGNMKNENVSTGYQRPSTSNQQSNSTHQPRGTSNVIKRGSVTMKRSNNDDLKADVN